MSIVNFLNQLFWTDSAYMILMAISLIWILTRKNEDVRAKCMAVYSALAFLFVICNPIIAPLGLYFFGEDKYAYLRIFYLVPLMSIIAYSGTSFYTEYVKRTDRTAKKAVYAAVIVITLILCGSLYDSTMYRKAENIYKIDQDALEISEIINEDSGNERVYVLLPGADDIVYGVRQYTERIIVAGNSDEVTDRESLAGAQESKAFEYLVIDKEKEELLAADMVDFYRLDETEHYVIYKKVDG